MKRSEKNDTLFRMILVLLIICDLASIAVLFARLDLFAPDGFQNVIPLTQSSGATTVTQTTRRALSQPTLQQTESTQQKKSITMQMMHHPTAYTIGTVAAFQVVPLSATNEREANPKLDIYDSDTVWVSETNVDIFRMTYDGDNGITVKSESSDKLIAPGTQNEYVFTLENTGDVLLDYEMTMEAYVTGTDLTLPVTARVWDYTGKQILGDENNQVDVMELNNVDEESKLSPGRFAVYTLAWEWPYEWGNDEYDTMLGNMAVDDELALTIKINVVSAYDPQSVKGEEITVTTATETTPAETTTPALITTNIPDTTTAPAQTEEIVTTDAPVAIDDDLDDFTSTTIDDHSGTDTTSTTAQENNNENHSSDSNRNNNSNSNNNNNNYTAARTTAKGNALTTVKATTDSNGNVYYGLESYSSTPKTGYRASIVPIVMTFALIIMILSKPKRKNNKETKSK
jgi:hypothetical protein